MQTAGFVLVGGKSTRMGTDKALLLWQARPLVLHLAELVAAAAGSVTLVGPLSTYEHLGLPIIPDQRDEKGPLAGLEAALDSRFARDLNLILACDMPALPGSLLLSLLHRARNTRAMCVAARDASAKVHPLCAVYRKECLPHIRSCLTQNRLRLTDLVETLDTDYVHSEMPIGNVNTPEEWAQWQTS